MLTKTTSLPEFTVHLEEAAARQPDNLAIVNHLARVRKLTEADWPAYREERLKAARHALPTLVRLAVEISRGRR